MTAAVRLQLRRGTTSQNESYTGSVGEITYDTQKKTIRIHDGTTIGGNELWSGWGSISGNITDQEDLNTKLQSKIDLDDIGWIDCGEITEDVLADYTSSMISSLTTAITNRITEVRTKFEALKTEVDSGVDFSQKYVLVSEWESEKASIESMLDALS